MGRQRLYEFGGSELCWWGAFLAWANDDFQMLRLSVSLMWIFVPLGFGVMG